jgi:iron complex transport system ATP-binding protein
VTDQNSPRISVQGLHFRHGHQEVLRGVTLDFYGGRHYILAGPNGAGKSTLIDLLAGLKKSAGGGIIVNGKPIGTYRPPDLARILALAPQDFRLDFAFTVREVVAMGRRPYLGRWGRLAPEDRKAVDLALSRLDISALAPKPVTALSGGERQRTLLARTLAQGAGISLLDEPTTALDVAHALTVMAEARARAEEGALVITVTHDLNLGAAFGHEFIFLKDGQVAAAGPTGQAFTADILTRVYEAEARVTRNDFTGSLVAGFRKSV